MSAPFFCGPARRERFSPCGKGHAPLAALPYPCMPHALSQPWGAATSSIPMRGTVEAANAPATPTVLCGMTTTGMAQKKPERSPSPAGTRVLAGLFALALVCARGSRKCPGNPNGFVRHDHNGHGPKKTGEVSLPGGYACAGGLIRPCPFSRAWWKSSSWPCAPAGP